MKPHMTWKTARRALTTRWWFLVLAALVAAAIAGFVAHRQPRSYTVSMTIKDAPGLEIGSSQIGGTSFKTLTVQPVPKDGWKVAHWTAEVPQSTLQDELTKAGLSTTPTQFLQNLKLPAALQENQKSLKVTSGKPAFWTFAYQTSSNPKQLASVMTSFLTTALANRRAALDKQIPLSIGRFTAAATNLAHGTRRFLRINLRRIIRRQRVGSHRRARCSSTSTSRRTRPWLRSGDGRRMVAWTR